MHHLLIKHGIRVANDESGFILPVVLILLTFLSFLSKFQRVLVVANSLEKHAVQLGRLALQPNVFSVKVLLQNKSHLLRRSKHRLGKHSQSCPCPTTETATTTLRNSQWVFSGLRYRNELFSKRFEFLCVCHLIPRSWCL